MLKGETIEREFPMDTVSILFPDIMAISTAGDYLFFGYNGRVIRMDRQGNASVVLDTKLIYGKHIDVGNLSIGADRYICFDNKRYVNTLNVTSYLFDIQEQTPLWERYDSDTYYNLENSVFQSADGKHIVLQDPYNIQFLTREANQIVDVKTLSLSVQGSYFHPTVPGKLILANANRINYYDVATGTTTIKSIEGIAANYGVAIAVDRVKGYFGFRYNGFYYIIEPMSAAIVKKFPIENYTIRFTLHNGNLYAGAWKYSLNLP